MVIMIKNHSKGHQYEQTIKEEVTEEEQAGSAEANSHGIKVMSLGIIAVGALLSTLGIIADNAQGLIISVGGVILLLGSVMFYNTQKRKRS